MNRAAFDSLARRTGAAVSRRASLVTLGGAALGAAVAAPALVDAGKAGKKAKKKCKKQVGKCKTVVEEFCADLGGEVQECLDALNPCCAFLKTCNSGASTECFIDELFIGGMMK